MRSGYTENRLGQRLNDPATVLALEYDRIGPPISALLQYADGEKSYILAPAELKLRHRSGSTKNRF